MSEYLFFRMTRVYNETERAFNNRVKRHLSVFCDVFGKENIKLRKGRARAVFLIRKEDE